LLSADLEEFILRRIKMKVDNDDIQLIRGHAKRACHPNFVVYSLNVGTLPVA